MVRIKALALNLYERKVNWMVLDSQIESDKKTASKDGAFI